MMPIITNEMKFIALMMALDIEMKLCVNARSVSVLVSAREFLNWASIWSEIAAELSGLLIRMIYQPTCPARMGASCLIRSSRYCQ